MGYVMKRGFYEYKEAEHMTIFAIDTKSGNQYPYRRYFLYPLGEAKRLYREEYGLKYKRGIQFYRSEGGMMIYKI